MSQNDFTIANQSFPNFRSDLNTALQALASTSSGTSAPSTTFANQLFYDTTNNILKIRNEDNDAFIPIALLDQTNDVITEIQCRGIAFSDGDDAMTIADGGACTFPQDVTGLTFTPTGDTSSGDSAAFGRTASEGAIITGQGSTNDVTIKNDADTAVIQIPTGTTNVSIAGDLTVGAIALSATTSVTHSSDTSLALDFGAGQNFVITMGGNITSLTATNETANQTGFIIFIQDSSGGRTVSPNSSDFKEVGGAGITLSSAGNAVDVVPYICKGANDILLGNPQLAFS